jgi:hypothetical protein
LSGHAPEKFLDNSLSRYTSDLSLAGRKDEYKGFVEKAMNFKDAIDSTIQLRERNRRIIGSRLWGSRSLCTFRYWKGGEFMFKYEELGTHDIPSQKESQSSSSWKLKLGARKMVLGNRPETISSVIYCIFKLREIRCSKTILRCEAFEKAIPFHICAFRIW